MSKQLPISVKNVFIKTILN